MNPSSLLSFLLFTLSLIVVSHAASSPPPSGTKLYQVVCNDAGNDKDRCLKLLEAYPQITTAKDYVKLCTFILKVAIKKGTQGQNYLKKLMKKNPSSNAIKECATNDYDGLVGSFKSSLSELVEDPLTANYDAKVAGDGPVTCERALAGEKRNIPYFLYYIITIE
ncbi:Pectinesterase inhibitor domain [Sesbania bispinosa]|nr:Pectinesterase inhibitor domain [Sesbania bispinosa]